MEYFLSTFFSTIFFLLGQLFLYAFAFWVLIVSLAIYWIQIVFVPLEQRVMVKLCASYNGGGGHGHGHSHNPYDTDSQEVGVLRLGFGGENLVAIAGLGDGVHGDVHGHVRNRASGHVHSPVPCHVQEGVYCVESWLHRQYHDDSDDNNDGDVGGIRCDNNDSDAHYLGHHHYHHLRCPRQFQFHCRYHLVLCPCVLTIFCPQSLKVLIDPHQILQREDFRPPGRWSVGAKLEVVGVHQISLASFQMKEF